MKKKLADYTKIFTPFFKFTFDENLEGENDFKTSKFEKWCKIFGILKILIKCDKI